jgi:hypothetical protein
MFNHERRHEELNNATPGSLYQPQFCDASWHSD